MYVGQLVGDHGSCRACQVLKVMMMIMKICKQSYANNQIKIIIVMI